METILGMPFVLIMSSNGTSWVYKSIARGSPSLPCCLKNELMSKGFVLAFAKIDPIATVLLTLSRTENHGKPGSLICGIFVRYFCFFKYCGGEYTIGATMSS